MKIFANSEAGNSADFSQELSDYAAGYRVPNVEEVLEFIAPSVAVPSKRFEYAKFGDGAMVVDTDDARATFGTFKTVQDSGDIVNAKLVSRGYTLVLDEDEFSANYRERAVENLKRRLLRNELYRAAALLAKVATSTAKKWLATGEGKSTPYGDLQNLVASVADAAGVHANRILFGESAWAYRYAAMIASTAVGEGASARLTPEQLAQLLAIDEIKISKDRYVTQEADGKKYKNILGANQVFAFNGMKGASIDDISTFKRFYLGEGFKVFVEQKAGCEHITVSHKTLLAQTGAGAVKALTVSNS